MWWENKISRAKKWQFDFLANDCGTVDGKLGWKEDSW